jgi:hypothetical protein
MAYGDTEVKTGKGHRHKPDFRWYPEIWGTREEKSSGTGC